MNQAPRIAFALYDGFSALDFAALYEPLARQGCDWATCALSTDIYDAHSLHFYPTCVTQSLSGYNWVILPGGPGARKRLNDPNWLAWLATADDSVGLAAVGEGVLLLAAAGLIRNCRAAARPEWRAELADYDVQAVDQPLVLDDRLATAALPAAALELAQRLYESISGQPLQAVIDTYQAIPVTGEVAAGKDDAVKDDTGKNAAENDAGAPRQATLSRQTGETQVEVRLDIDGTGRHQIDTGLPFLDHMLTQVAVHGLFDLYIQAKGDLHIDPHHTMEDVALTLGSAFQQALGSRAGIVRMASADCPMDESLAWVAVDFSGRPYCVFQTDWHGYETGNLPNSLFAHFFESFALNARCNLHAAVRYGRDDHHQAEALFKALGRALCAATRIDPRRAGQVPSSKGILF